MAGCLRNPMRLRLCLGLASVCAVLLAGCATPSGAPGQSDEAKRLIARLLQMKQSQREQDLNSSWRGKPYDALLGRYGEPPLTLNVIGERPLKTSLVVYTLIDNDTQCVDAFTMVKDGSNGQWSVSDYFCR